MFKHTYHIRRMKTWRDASAFTLVEMIVSLAIFAIVAVTAVGALVRVVGANRAAQAAQDAATGLSFVLETMGREIRVGSRIYCALNPNTDSSFDPTTYPTSGTTNACATLTHGNNEARVIVFQSAYTGTNSFNPNVSCKLAYAYYFNSTAGPGGAQVVTVSKAQQYHCDDRLYYVADPAHTVNGFFNIFDSAQYGNLVLSDYRLSVINPVANGDTLVAIRLKGTAGIKAGEQTDFDVQTLVSQRIHD